MYANRTRGTGFGSPPAVPIDCTGPMPTPVEEAARRRTFAIISHPDAGKTTLTEKFLLYGGALQSAGAVKARGERRRVTSDWMEMEQKRGISITSTVLQFPYRDAVLNLLDTPGHRDFSEDTYRVLAAADAAIMVLDAAKGIEPQTLKLFEVCRERNLPLLTFINKWDRPGREALELLDQIESQLAIVPTPVTWPVGIAGDFRGVVDRRTGEYVRFTRTARGATEAGEELLTVDEAGEVEGATWTHAADDLSLLDEVGAHADPERFRKGEVTPVFFGSALTNFGVRLLLDAVVDLAPAPSPRDDVNGLPRPLDAPFSAFAFKVQANMDPSHRDRIAFVRVCSGRFERGMVVTHGPTGKPFATKYAHSVFGQERDTIDEAWPGDVIGLVNATDVTVGDALYLDVPVEYPRLPEFAPEHFVVARVQDTGRFKQFRRGIAQLDEEGVVQVLRDQDLGDQAPMLAAVGPMQFEVAAHRLEHEFGAPTELSATSWRVARKTDEASTPSLRGLHGVAVYARADGTRYALFESPYWLARVESDHPELVLERLVAEGTVG
jgi:peptide chain release factor 3